MSESNGEFTFDLTLIEVSVTLNGEQYTLREADGEAGAEYENARFKGAVIDEETGTVSTLPNIGDREATLVSLCLFDKDNNRVPEVTIRSWPARVVNPLAAKAREISGMEEGAEDVAALKRRLARANKRVKTAKNEPSATTGG